MDPNLGPETVDSQTVDPQTVDVQTVDLLSHCVAGSKSSGSETVELPMDVCVYVVMCVCFSASLGSNSLFSRGCMAIDRTGAAEHSH